MNNKEFINYISATVLRESWQDVVEFYDKVNNVAKENYGEGRVHDQGTEKESTSYIIEENKIIFVRPRVLELDNTYYDVSFDLSSF